MEKCCDHQTSPKAAPSVGAGDYTCPMHPEVRAGAADPCPICGMALEPVFHGLEPDAGLPREAEDMKMFQAARRTGRPGRCDPGSC